MLQFSSGPRALSPHVLLFEDCSVVEAAVYMHVETRAFSKWELEMEKR